MILSETDFMTAVNDLLIKITGIEQSRLFRGNQSREVLPADGEFIIYTPITRGRIGTNITSYGAVEDDIYGDYADKVLVTVDLQVDCYGDTADNTAQKIEMFGRSELCNAWLKNNGYAIRVLTTTDPNDLTIVDDTRQYLKRFMLTMKICFTSELKNDVPWFDDVQITAIKNVDVFFKP